MQPGKFLGNSFIYGKLGRLKTNLTTWKTGVQWRNPKLLTVVIQKSRMDMAQILQGLSCKVCSTISLKSLAFGLFIIRVVFGISSFILHQQVFAMLRRHLRFANMVNFSTEIIKQMISF